MILLDTSAIYALADSADPNHHHSVGLFGRALQSGEAILTHSYVIVEAAALLQHRLGLASALIFLQESEAFETCWVGPEDHRAAVEILTQRDKRKLSLVDCVSFVVMRRLGVRQALAFDEDFAQEGFSLYG